MHWSVTPSIVIPKCKHIFWSLYKFRGPPEIKGEKVQMSAHRHIYMSHTDKHIVDKIIMLEKKRCFKGVS
jgi:hypothetical protein